MNNYSFEGFQDLGNELKEYIEKAEKPLKILEIGAKELTKDLLKLARPISKIRKSGYTHLIRTFAYRVTEKDIEVGWGKYYGPLIENGANIKIRHTSKKKFVRNQHLAPVFNRNKDKYYQLMLKEFYK